MDQLEPAESRQFARFFVGAGIAHDFLWAPAAVALGLLTTRIGHPTIRRAARIGLAFTALLVLVSWGQVHRYGARVRNPSLLPLDYGRNLVALLAGLWLCVGAFAIVQSVRRRR